MIPDNSQVNCTRWQKRRVIDMIPDNSRVNIRWKKRRVVNIMIPDNSQIARCIAAFDVIHMPVKDAFGVKETNGTF